LIAFLPLTFCFFSFAKIGPRIKSRGSGMVASRIRSTISTLIERRCVEDADIGRLRDLLAAGGGLTAVEAGDLVRLERHVTVMSPLWLAFFVEALTGFFFWEHRPTGKVTAADIEWLAFRLGFDSTGPTPASRALFTVLREECADPPDGLTRRLARFTAAPPPWQRFTLAASGIMVA
jgi:hypothetical protein